MADSTVPQRPHHRFWPKRLPHAMTPPQTSLWDNLAISARRYPDKAALVFFGRVFSYAQTMAMAERLAARLHALGVRKGDRVMLDMQNSPQLVIAHFAILRANAVVVPVNPMNRAEELKHYITDPDAKVAIATGDVAADIAKADAQLPPEQRLSHLIVTQYTDAFDPAQAGADAPPAVWKDWLLTRHPLPQLASGTVMDWTAALANDLPLPPLEVGPEDLAVLPYTSGTTGLPKGCMHPHRSLMHNAVASAAWGNGTAETVTLLVVPMFHITGMVSVLHSSIYIGATLVVMPRWDRELAGRLISGWKVTNWTNIPTMVIDLLGSPNFDHYDLSSLAHIGGGGAAMPQAVAQRLQDQFGLRYVEGYGLTETAAPSHSNPVDAPKQQCLGIPFMSCDSRVVDPETLRELPVGEQGEIIMRGPMVFSGYWKRPEATEAAFIDFEGQRFFRSGD
ncbi:MAG: Long-chain-fatty-acid--CoA ligase, partial [uncultured Ramlibacter sp.]